MDFSKLNYDNTCAYLDDRNIHDADTKKYLLDLLVFCKKIKPYVSYYKRQIKSYNNTAHNILKKKIDLISPQISGKQTFGIITTIVCSFIGLAYEGIPNFLHNKRNKALHKAVKVMDSKTSIQHNKLIQLENSRLIHGIYNAEMLENLLTQYIASITLLHLMKNYLQDNKAH